MMLTDGDLHSQEATADTRHPGDRGVALPLLLTREELISLTSARQPKRMAAWLQSRGWVFEPGARVGDIPKVDRCYYLARMSGQQVIGPGLRRPRVRVAFMTQGRSFDESAPRQA